MKIFYSVIVLCIFHSIFCYSEDHIRISERTREELYIIIDETVHPELPEKQALLLKEKP